MDIRYGIVNWIMVFGLCLVLFTVERSEADEVHFDDTIISGSACVGVDCATDGSEVFDFDTLRLKENNLRIHFEDTSTAADFPTNDWRIVINDYNKYGADYFGIEDSTAGEMLFRVNAGGDISLGSGTVANTIRVGSPGFEGLITNVAPGVSDTDAVNMFQLNAVSIEVGNNTSDIAANTADIATNTAGIAANLADIATNSAGIAANSADIAANTSGIAANTADIANNSADIDSISADISNLQVDNQGFSYTEGSTSAAASASGFGSTALGSGSSALDYDTAVGYNATVSADGSVALGANSSANSQNSVAVGADSLVQAGANGGTALGQNAQVQTGATGSVALGQNSVANEANTVSVGSTGSERRITNVADGVNDTDAANMRQLNALVGGGIDRVSSRVDRLDHRLNSVGALAAAYSSLVPGNRSKGDTQISLGMGYYRGANAVAGGIFHYVNDNVMINVGGCLANRGEASGRMGITFGW